jgi:hypothetical protein
MRRWLESVCDDTLHLNLRIPDNYGWDHGHNHAKVSGSPALIRLEPLALVDPRTGPVEEASADYEENQAELSRSIPFTVCSWAALLAEEHDLKSDVSTMGASVTLLLAQWEALVGSLWVDEFYSVMSKIKQALNRAHNRRPPLPRGECFTCGTQLWQEDGNGEDTVACPNRDCGRVYDQLGLVKLRLQQDRERA